MTWFTKSHTVKKDSGKFWELYFSEHMMRINVSLSLRSLVSTLSAFVTIALFDKAGPTTEPWILAIEYVTVTTFTEADILSTLRRNNLAFGTSAVCVALHLFNRF
jgi:hypothetical protein